MKTLRWLVHARRWLGTRSGRRGVKLMVVAGGLLWCSSWPAFVGGPHPRGESLANKAAREIDQPVELHRVSPDEAAARVRALLTRRAPGDLARARSLLDAALAAAPRERERRRGLERLRAALARLEREEKALGANLHAAAVDPSRAAGSGQF